MRRSAMLLIIVSAGIITSAVAQQQRVKPSHRQFLFNPYLYNPAFAGIKERAELSVVYKKQWMNVEGAPVTTGLSLQLPATKRVMLALNIITDKQVLLRTTSILGTFGYVIPIDHRQSLRFALSGGVGNNDLDLNDEELNVADPAVLRAIDNNYHIDGNFGMVYTHGGLRIGFALTELFRADPFSQEAFNEFSMANLKNRTYSLSYRFCFDRFERVCMEPYIVYKQSAYRNQNAWEAATVFFFANSISTGVSYHQYGGVGLLFGLDVVGRFSFSYHYEFPPFKTDFSAAASHELQMSFRFGEKKVQGRDGHATKRAGPVNGYFKASHWRTAGFSKRKRN